MPTVRTGFGKLEESQARDDAAFKGKYIPYLRLRDDGDSVKLRVVSEYGEEEAQARGVYSVMVSASFHRTKLRGRTGSEIWATVICALDEDEDGELSGQCDLCDVDNKFTKNFMLWVWVYAKYHRAQSTDPKVEWKRGTLGKQAVYAEPMNRFMVWQDGYFMKEQIKGRIERYGSLTDRDYLITRHGIRNTTKVTRDLESWGDESKIPPEVLEASRNLPALSGIATGEITNMDGSGEGRERERDSDTGKTYDEVALPTFDSPDKPRGEISAEELDDLPF